MSVLLHPLLPLSLATNPADKMLQHPSIWSPRLQPYLLPITSQHYWLGGKPLILLNHFNLNYPHLKKSIAASVSNFTIAYDVSSLWKTLHHLSLTDSPFRSKPSWSFYVKSTFVPEVILLARKLPILPILGYNFRQDRRLLIFPVPQLCAWDIISINYLIQNKYPHHWLKKQTIRYARLFDI